MIAGLEVCMGGARSMVKIQKVKEMEGRQFGSCYAEFKEHMREEKQRAKIWELGHRR